MVCTTEGAYLMRSYTEDGAVFYDPPVLISDASHENGLVPKQNTDFRDATAADLDGDGVSYAESLPITHADHTRHYGHGHAPSQPASTRCG